MSDAQLIAVAAIITAVLGGCAGLLKLILDYMSTKRSQQQGEKPVVTPEDAAKERVQSEASKLGLTTLDQDQTASLLGHMSISFEKKMQIVLDEHKADLKRMEQRHLEEMYEQDLRHYNQMAEFIESYDELFDYLIKLREMLMSLGATPPPMPPKIRLVQSPRPEPPMTEQEGL